MFDSRDPAYRDPVGAVAAGTRVHFRITLPRSLGCSGAVLAMEQEGGAVRRENMFWCGMNGDDREWWECHCTPEAAGLYFYHFELQTASGPQRLSRRFQGKAALGGATRWQLTVYAKDFAAPRWLLGGVMYQIFPDRFAASGQEKPGVPADRVLHGDWYEQPNWRPNAQGRITNNDYFGGDLKGIREKLPYLKSLGVTCIYCNPIFEAHSNHRYDTADYSKIDPMLGDEAELTALCAEARALGIRVLLDGVFSHTGSDSVYFNREGRYPGPGAYQSQDSPYYSWYAFRHWPDEYDCWWDFLTLPNVRETQPAYDDYINGENGIVRKWLRAGASGWRLDVADELPDAFLDSLTAAARAERSDALVLGEVWEDASNKSAYGVRRRYLLGGQLDSVMNYPFRDAIFSFLLGGQPEQFAETVESICENYPAQCLHILMNHIGTHDTERALTVLGGEPAGGRGREWQSAQRLSPQQRALALQRLRLASLIQFLLPGVPCIYYGDEAGMEGYRDPFSRAAYPWGREDQALVQWYKDLGQLRAAESNILAEGAYRTLLADNNLLCFQRQNAAGDRLVVLVNRSVQPQRVPDFGLALGDGAILLGEPLALGEQIGSLGYFLARFPGEKKSL